MIKTFLPLDKVLTGPRRGAPLSAEMKQKVLAAIKTKTAERESVLANMTKLQDNEED